MLISDCIECGSLGAFVDDDGRCMMCQDSFIDASFSHGEYALELEEVL